MATQTITYPDVHTHFRAEFYEKAKSELGKGVGMETVFDLATDRFEQAYKFKYPNTYWAWLKRHYKK